MHKDNAEIPKNGLPNAFAQFSKHKIKTKVNEQTLSNNVHNGVPKIMMKIKTL